MFSNLWMKQVTFLLLVAMSIFASGGYADEAAPQVTENGLDEVAAELPDYVGWLELSGPIREGGPRYAWVGADEQGVTLRRILSELQQVEENERYAGLVVYLDQPMLSVSQIQEIDEAIQRVRAAGKTVIAFAEAYTLGGYLLACSADQIILQNKGNIILTGLGVEEMYLAGLLDKIGLKADLIQVGEYKGAADSLVGSEPSEAWSQNIDGLLDDYYDQIVSHIASRRALSVNKVRGIFDDSWTMTDEQYVRRKVVDGLSERDLVSVTSDVFGENFAWSKLLQKDRRDIQMDNPFAMFSMIFQPRQAAITRPSIALITARGAIHSGESGGDGMFSDESIGSRTLVKALRKVKDNNLIKGVVLRIDSPGGSALASEMIWQAVREVSAQKPVYVSVGAMAASGGYYIACGGDQIFVSPMSVVGSIGVVGGKIVLGGLYEKIGVNVHRRTRGPMGDLFNSVDPFTDEQREKITVSMTNIYEQFTGRVEAGRGDRLPDIDIVARGRLFTGRQAVRNGMADRIGGVEVAIQSLASSLELEAGDYDVINLPEPKSFQEFFDEMFAAEAKRSIRHSAAVGMARQVLGDKRWQAIASVLSGIMLLEHEPVLTIMPHAIVVD